MERMAKDGVQHVLYMGPYYVAVSTGHTLSQHDA